jgi:phosphatidate cytidylyltransferase
VKNILQRTISGIIYLAIVIGSLFLNQYIFGGVFLVIGLMALIEFFSLAGLKKSSPFLLLGMLIASVAYAIAYFVMAGMISSVNLSVLILLPLLSFTGVLYSRDKDALKKFALTISGVLYIFVPLILMIYLTYPSVNGNFYTHRVVLGILSLIWINDTFAYLSGITFGNHKLFPRISPKKSWEGFMGGTVITIVASIWLNRVMGILSVNDWIILAGIVCVFGVYGDLAESFVKRVFNKKDSGSLIPGHGGVLDRIDSILFVMPVSFFYLIINQL